MRLIDADKLLNDNRELADCDFVHPLYEDTLRDIIDDAPTVEVCEDCISRDEAIRIAEQGQIQGYEWQFKQLCNLPSVTPQPRVGHWIRTRTWEHDGELYCSKCGFAPHDERDCDNFCTNCGAKMEVEE